MASPTEAGVVEKLRDPGWTPGARDVGPLLELIGAEAEEPARDAERALLKIDARQWPKVADEVVGRARAATRPARGRLTKLAGRLALGLPPEAAGARAWLLEALGDADPKARRAAARALGKLPRSEEIERALLAAWDAAPGDDDRRALAEALGKVGSAAARERLARASAGGAPDKKVTRATLMLERGEARLTPGAIDLSRAFDGPIVVRFHTRSGLEHIALGELTERGEQWRPRVAGAGLVEARLTGPLARAAEVRTATHAGFPLDPVKLEGDLAEAVVDALLSPRARGIFAAFTRADGAPVRFRLSWLRGGHRRGVVWRCAELVRARTAELVNDPTESTWEVVVDEDDGFAVLELVPRGFEDARFAYREATVPASSHPTIAAALARIAPRSDRDVVWDPFVGAGAELVERAKLGPYARLIGTDVEQAAIDAARANLGRAGVQDATLELADATSYAPEGVTVIVSNPPMGRRVQRGAHAGLLERFVDHAAEVLVPGGSLVWTVPEPRRVHARAERAGLVLKRAWTVDMGGFPAALSVHEKRG